MQSCDLWMFVKENPDRKEKIKENSLNWNWAIPEKYQSWGERGEVEDMKFPGVYQKRACGISKGDQENIIWNFQGSWFLALKFPMDLTKMCGIYRHQGWSFVLSGISKGKVKKWKIPGGFQKKYVLNPPLPPPICFLFWNSPLQL